MSVRKPPTYRASSKLIDRIGGLSRTRTQHVMEYDQKTSFIVDRKIKASESRFNQKFMDFAEYYGIVIRLCYPYRPETKGKI